MAGSDQNSANHKGLNLGWSTSGVVFPLILVIRQ